MKKLLYTIAIALTIMTIACKKEKAVSINGYWTGTSTTSTLTTTFFSVLFNSDGTGIGYALNADTTLAFKALAFYRIDADSVRTTFIAGSDTTLFSGKLSADIKQMNGTYRRVSGTSHGTFSIAR